MSTQMRAKMKLMMSNSAESCDAPMFMCVPAKAHRRMAFTKTTRSEVSQLNSKIALQNPALLRPNQPWRDVLCRFQSRSGGPL